LQRVLEAEETHWPRNKPKPPRASKQTKILWHKTNQETNLKITKQNPIGQNKPKSPRATKQNKPDLLTYKHIVGRGNNSTTIMQQHPKVTTFMKVLEVSLISNKSFNFHFFSSHPLHVYIHYIITIIIINLISGY
jgi:hypothetical protein